MNSQKKVAIFYLLDAFFLAKRPIRSLPEMHGARWSAWLRFACRNLRVDLGDVALAILPLRNGQKTIESGEILPLRITVKDTGIPQLGPLTQQLKNMASHGQFSPDSLELLFWQDAIAKSRFPPDSPPTKPEPVSRDIFTREAASLEKLPSFSLQFFTPLRLKLPSGAKRDNSGQLSYCQADFFDSPSALEHLCARVRFLEPAEKLPADDLRIASKELEWHDMRYSETRQIALGGIRGSVKISGRPSRSRAERLVAGQYLGAGKNPLFGLGYWRIPELDCVRELYLAG